jgi:hypothetical protein
MPQRPVQATNAIIVNGTPHIEEYEVETTTDMYPGRLVIPGTNAHQIKVATDNCINAIGVLDVAPSGNRDTIYAAGAQAKVIKLGSPCTVMMLVLSGGTIAVGGMVQCAGAGKIDQAATVNAAVGQAEEAKSGITDGWIMVDIGKSAYAAS